jgi:hypothetical protein
MDEKGNDDYNKLKLNEFLQILQNPKYTSDLNEQLVGKISGMIQHALDTLSKVEHNDTLDQTLGTET